MPACIDGIGRFQASVDAETQVILVDDGSTDETPKVAERLGRGLDNFLVLRRPHLGKGAALRSGVLESTGGLVFLADADWSMPPEQASRFLLPGFESEVRIGSREAASSKRHDEPVTRHLLGRVFNAYVRALALPEIQDSQCGFKCLPGDLARQVFGKLQTDGWAFDVEILLRVKKTGIPVREIGIDWHHDADTRLQPLQDAARMAWEVWRITRDVS